MIGAITVLFSVFASANPTESPPARPSPLASILPPRTMFLDGQTVRLSICQFPEDIAPIGICVYVGPNGCVYGFKQDDAESKWDALEKRCPEVKKTGAWL